MCYSIVVQTCAPMSNTPSFCGSGVCCQCSVVDFAVHEGDSGWQVLKISRAECLMQLPTDVLVSVSVLFWGYSSMFRDSGLMARKWPISP